MRASPRLAGSAFAVANAEPAPRLLEPAGHAVGQQIDDGQERDAHDDIGVVGEARRDEIHQDGERDHADQRPPQPLVPPSSAMMTTRKEIIGIEGGRRLDIGVARRHDRAGDADEGAGDHEQHDLGAGGVDARMLGDRLVIADDLHREAEPRAVDQPAGQEDHDVSASSIQKMCISRMSVKT
jgi:hypothetical protein